MGIYDKLNIKKSHSTNERILKVWTGGYLVSKILQFSALIVFLFLAGCNSISTYDDNEAAALVKGREITIGDLRYIYPDDTALDYLEGAIEVELVKQEVKEMGLDISDKLSDADNWLEELPPKNTKDAGGKQIRRFAESQAKKLNMKPEQFQREYAKIINEQNAYMNTYLEEMLGEGNLNDEKWLDEFGEEVTRLLAKLVEENKDEIEVLIK